MKKVTKTLIIMLTSLLGFAYFITGYVVKKHDEVRVIRASLKTPPHTVGSNCLMGGESIAILKRYLDNSDHWVYDVMVLDDESMMAKNSIIHKSIKYCEE